MNTKLIYLENSDTNSCQARILNSKNDEKGSYFTFDQTVFYPQGGGQESDQGIIEFFLKKNVSVKKEVKKVLFVNGIAHHYVDEIQDIDINKIEYAQLTIDVSLRKYNSKLHSAGHLIASIVEEIDSGLRAIKGFHFQQGSYIGFEILEQKERDFDKIIKDLSLKINQSIINDLKVTTELTTLDELKKVCKYVPSYLPKNKPLRVVTIEDYFPIPCGGTHVKSFSTFNSITINKIRNKKGEIKISYAIA